MIPNCLDTGGGKGRLAGGTGAADLRTDHWRMVLPGTVLQKMDSIPEAQVLESSWGTGGKHFGFNPRRPGCGKPSKAPELEALPAFRGDLITGQKPGG